jgi:hypothetical protein
LPERAGDESGRARVAVHARVECHISLDLTDDGWIQRLEYGKGPRPVVGPYPRRGVRKCRCSGRKE